MAAWDPPSPAACDVLRQAAQMVLDQPEALVVQVDTAVIDVVPPALADEPTLAAEVAASNRANLLHWARCNVREPGARVPAELSSEVLGIVRDTVRRGIESTIPTSYRIGQNIAWQFCMELAFALSPDRETLKETLDVTARSIFTFVDDMLTALDDVIERERRELTRGTHAERFEVINMILDGSPITARRAQDRLGYDLSQRHRAAVLWSPMERADQTELVQAAERLARAVGAHRPLTLVASAASAWAWFAGTDDLDLEAAQAAVDPASGVRAAIGPAAEGMQGFRLSHLDAVATQRLMMRSPGDTRVARYEDVALVALATHDQERAAEFVARALGDLATADADLRETLRVYIEHEFSASRAARALFAHRNTVLNRLHRAVDLLPEPLEGRGLEVGVALEIERWLGIAAEA